MTQGRMVRFNVPSRKKVGKFTYVRSTAEVVLWELYDWEALRLGAPRRAEATKAHRGRVCVDR